MLRRRGSIEPVLPPNLSERLLAVHAYDEGQPGQQPKAAAKQLSVREGYGVEGGLLWELTWPLFFQTLANEVQIIVMTALWGHLGTKALAAGNIATSFQYFTLVVIYGAQNTVYTLAPQAHGAGRTDPKAARQVGIVLQVVLLWACVVASPVIALSWCFTAPVLEALSLVNTTDHGLHDELWGFGLSSATWVIPMAAVTTVTTWLDSISIVKAPSFISAAFAFVQVGAAWLLMGYGDAYLHAWFGVPVGSLNYGLNGYAWASLFMWTAQGLVLYLVVVVWRKELTKDPEHTLWHGWDLRAAVGCAINKRFLAKAAPMVVQYALNTWTSTVFQMLMSSRSVELAAAYGVTSTYVSTAGSVANALFMAVSTRVGDNLGAGDHLAAYRAAVVGFLIAVVSGLVISGTVFSVRVPLTGFYTPDEDIQRRALSAAPYVCVYYFMNSCVWSLWAILQGQMRTCVSAVALSGGMWGVSVPLALLTTHYDVYPKWFGIGPLPGVWISCCIGEACTFVFMLLAVMCSDWPALAVEAQESATLGVEEEGGEGEEDAFAREQAERAALASEAERARHDGRLDPSDTRLTSVSTLVGGRYSDGGIQ